MAKELQVIKYEGDNTELFKRISAEGLEPDAKLVVPETHNAILIKDGVLMDTLNSGSYEIFDQSSRRKSKNVLVEVIYLSKTARLNVLWGTKSRFCFRDPETDVPVKVGAHGEFEVQDTIKLLGGKVGHVGRVTKGMFKVGDKVSLEVASKKHADTCKNHSATHLLQKALKTVLGDHVEQKGSLVTPDRLRFDFSHFEAMTPEEIEKVEAIVNQEIQAALPVVTDVMSIEEAKKTGAMALFDEKYEEKVRVVSMGDFSKELCGGTHVSNTSQILVFKIVSEAGIAAGVRRIEALTGDGVFAYYKEIERQLHQAAKTAKTTPAGLNEKIEHLQAEIRELHSENESLKSKMAKDALGDVMDQVQEIGGVKVLAARVDGVDMNGLRDLGDQLKEKLGEGVVVLASAVDGKVSLMATATDGAQKKGAHAGNLIKAIAGLVGGGGGGRPGMAQAGGKNPDGIDAAIAKAAEVAAEQLGQ